MRKEYFQILKQHLKANITAFKLVDLDLSQYNQTGEDHVLATPCAYIGLGQIQWQTLGNDVQRGLFPFTVTCIAETMYGDGRDLTDTTNINILNLEKLVYQKLFNERFMLSQVEGFEALANTSNDLVIMESIVRLTTSPHVTLDNLIKTSVSFHSTVFDYTATKLWTKIMATLEIDAEINR